MANRKNVVAAPANSVKRIGHLLRNSMVIALLAAVLTATVSSDGFGEPGVPLGAGAQKSLETGISAYQDGALEVAVEALSDALLQGELSQQQTAEAVYYRGLAYRELGKPGQAISDLTSAISLNALSKAHLKEATRNRAGAYREAGITSTESVVTAETAEQDSRVSVGVPASRAPAPVAVLEDQPSQPEASSTSSIPSGSRPPAPEHGFVAAFEKLIPDWP
jgi:tetratricopeptide (TPR) repeat protein